MAHRRLLVDRVLCIAWRPPDLEDLAAIVAELGELRARLGRPLLYFSVIGKSAIPQGPVRDAITGFYGEVLASCDSMHVVIEGGEFEQSIKRSVIASALLVVTASRGRVFVENTIEKVLHASPASVRTELMQAAQAAASQRFWDYARDDTIPPPRLV